VFGNVSRHKKRRLEELLVLNGLEEERVLYDEERGSCH
jgi:hypothetical protein